MGMPAFRLLCLRHGHVFCRHESIVPTRSPRPAQGEDVQRCVAMRVELSSESNLFFHYTHDLDESSFRSLQEGQKLMVDFVEYPSVLVRMLNHCIKEPHSHLAVFVMNRDGSARLDFIQVRRIPPTPPAGSGSVPAVGGRCG